MQRERTSKGSASLPRLGIVGAGVAGLTVARRLAGRVTTTLFDKSRGVSGRTSTRRADDARFDHGAQYITAKGAEFAGFLAACEKEGAVARWSPRTLEITPQRTSLVEPDPDSPWFVGTPGMNALAKHLAEGLDVRTQARVSSITQAEGAWTVATDDGRSEAFDIVVVAVPAEQAVDLLASAPAFQREAARVESAPCWSVMLQVPGSLDLPFDALRDEGGDLVWAACNGAKPGRSDPPTADGQPTESWVLHASAAWTRDRLDANAEDVAAELIELFRARAELDAIVPSFTAAHRWLLAFPQSRIDADFLWDAESRMGVCGDWCHSPRVEGAYLSASALSAAMAASLA